MLKFQAFIRREITQTINACGQLRGFINFYVEYKYKQIFIPKFIQYSTHYANVFLI